MHFHPIIIEMEMSKYKSVDCYPITCSYGPKHFCGHLGWGGGGGGGGGGWRWENSHCVSKDICNANMWRALKCWFVAIETKQIFFFFFFFF